MHVFFGLSDPVIFDIECLRELVGLGDPVAEREARQHHGDHEDCDVAPVWYELGTPGNDILLIISVLSLAVVVVVALCERFDISLVHLYYL